MLILMYFFTSGRVVEGFEETRASAVLGNEVKVCVLSGAMAAAIDARPGLEIGPAAAACG